MTIQVEENLRTTKSTIENAKLNLNEWCQNLRPKDTRYSIINKDGTILCDSNPEKQGKKVNDMTEVEGSLKQDFFSQVRHSDFFGTKALFASLKFSDDTVIRKIVPITSLKDDMNRFDRVIFLRIVPFSLLSYLIFLILFYNATKPLGGILNKVEQFNIDIPFNKNLQLMYKKDEWSRINEALNEADHQLKTQITNVRMENEKIATILESIYDDIIAIDPYETVLFYNSNFGVLYDVTEFKLTEQMRVDFVANVSHEIRTPLTSIKGYTQLLESQKNKFDPELHTFLEKIVVNTERMIALFNDLLNLSVIESKDVMKFDVLDLKELIFTVAGNIRASYPNKKISITKDIQLTTITGDDRLMEQVISNLVDNACKYSGDTISINISTYTKENKGYISIADDGPGISKEHIQRIFERFYRVDSSRETTRGTGLGLSIVKHIISKHGGKIWAESEETHGTKFVIELPLA